MSFDGVRFLVQVRKLAIRTIRKSSRSVHNHPFLVGAFLFVIFLYRASPFLFSVLVSASPVLVCTAILLGALLSFGHPQIPQIEQDDKICSEVSSFRIVAAKSTTIFQKEAVVVGRDDEYAETKNKESADKDIEEASLLGDVCSASKFEPGTLTSWEIIFDQKSVKEANAKNKNGEIEITKENHDGMLRCEGSTNEVQRRIFENDMSAEGSVDGHNDHLEFSSVPWTQMNGDHGHGDDEDDPSDSGSDGAESSSPDPSMADFIPLLDELHPVIVSEDRIPGNLSCGSSCLLRYRSCNSHESSINLDGETDHKEAGEDEAGDDDDDDEEENRADKEDAEESAITWTEDDQKNLMDLGSSELERNQRLENLIATRRNMTMMMKRNLIELDGFDLPFQVPTISTTRQNPFDFPNDTYENMGLPPLPGSAPSILLPSRNPFDLPCDSNEEKLDLMGDSFQQELLQLNHKEPVLCKHENLHIESSFFDFSKIEGRDAHCASRFRPYFLPDRFASEGSYSSFMRQSSDISESSSFERQTIELSETSLFHRRTSGLSESSSVKRQSIGMGESKASSAAETEPVFAEVDQERTKLNDDSTEETIPDSELDHVSLHVEDGSQSSDDFDNQYEKRVLDLSIPEIRLGQLKTDSTTEFCQSEAGRIVDINLGCSGNNPEVNSWMSAENIATEMHLMEKPVEQKYYGSSGSLLSEVHNDIEELNEELVKGDEIGFHLIEKSNVQAQKVFEAADFHHHHSGHTHSAERSTFQTNLTLETIEEEHISSSNSSLVSEEHSNTEGIKLNGGLVNMEHIMPDVDNNSDAPTEQALDVSNFYHTMDVEDRHSKDLVYDSSPQAAKNGLFISSEHTVEKFAELEKNDLKLERDGLLGKYDRVTVAGTHTEIGDKVCDISSDSQYPASIDLNLSSIVERQNDAVAEHSSSAQIKISLVTESIEEPKLINKDALLSEVTTYPENLVEEPGNVDVKLVSVANKGHLKNGRLMFHPSDYEEESSVIPEKLEEVISENKLLKEDNIEMNDFPELSLQTVGTSSRAQELRQKPVTSFFDFRERAQELGQEPVTSLFDFKEPVEGRSETECPSPIVEDAEGKSQFGDSIAPDKIMIDEMKDMEEALLSELDAVGDFCVADVGMDLNQDTLAVEKANTLPVPDAIFICRSKLEVENAETGMDESSDSRVPESKTWSQVWKPESSENIEESNDQITGRSSLDIKFINRSETKVENTQAGMDEFLGSHVSENKTCFAVLEPESSENIEKSSDESAEKPSSDVMFSNRSDIKVENTEAGINEFPGSHVSGSKTWFAVPGPESSENIDKSSDENAEKSSSDILFINRSETKVENAEAGIDEIPDSCMLEGKTAFHVLRRESIENIEQSSDENDGRLAPEVSIIEPRVENAEAGTDEFQDFHMLESKTTVHVQGPESIKNVEETSDVNTEISGTIQSLDLQDELLREETEISSMKYSESAKMTIEPITFHGNASRLEKDEPAAEISGSAPSMEEEIEKSAVASIDVSVTEKDEPYTEESSS